MLWLVGRDQDHPRDGLARRVDGAVSPERAGLSYVRGPAPGRLQRAADSMLPGAAIPVGMLRCHGYPKITPDQDAWLDGKVLVANAQI
jgi:hypothetical protein